MSELLGFPMVSQRLTVLSDGSPDPNRSFDCVPESIASAMTYLTGKPFEGGVLKEAVYGRDYQGPTAASAYVSYVAQHGVKLQDVPTVSYADAVRRAHLYLAEGIPVICTEQDDYAPVIFRDEWTHVVVWYKDTPTSLTAMDPFIGEPITYSDAEWSQRLRSTDLWILEKESEDVVAPITIQTPGVSGFFEQDGSQWKSKFAYNPAIRKVEPSSNGPHIGNAILKFYQTMGGYGLNGLTDAGLPLTPEFGVIDGATAQVFERGCILVYDPEHKIDNPPGSGAVYKLNLSSKVAQKIIQQLYSLGDTSALQSQLDTLNKQVASLQADNKLLVTHVQELNAQSQATQQQQAEIARLKAIFAEVEKLASEATTA